MDTKKVRIHHRTSLVRWSLYKYKCLWSVGGKGRGSSFRRKLHTHIHLDPTSVEILSSIKKIKNKKNKIFIKDIYLHIFWMSSKYYLVQ